MLLNTDTECTSNFVAMGQKRRFSHFGVKDLDSISTPRNTFEIKANTDGYAMLEKNCL